MKTREDKTISSPDDFMPIQISNESHDPRNTNQSLDVYGRRSSNENEELFNFLIKQDYMGKRRSTLFDKTRMEKSNSAKKTCEKEYHPIHSVTILKVPKTSQVQHRKPRQADMVIVEED
jgi:hypothetical protein